MTGFDPEADGDRFLLNNLPRKEFFRSKRFSGDGVVGEESVVVAKTTSSSSSRKTTASFFDSRKDPPLAIPRSDFFEIRSDCDRSKVKDVESFGEEVGVFAVGVVIVVEDEAFLPSTSPLV